MALETIEQIEEPATSQAKILVVDDQPDVREALRLLLKGAGFAIDTAATPAEALAAAAHSAYDLILADMNFTWDTTSGQEGLRLVDSLRAERPDAAIIAMTGWSTVELAVDAMQRGACDFIPKPWDNRRLISAIQRHLNAQPKRPRPIDAELAIARNIQRKLLPEPHFTARGLNCECASKPAREIGGDLYDFLAIDPSTSAFLLGDVSGKGIGAALLGANLQATIRGQHTLAHSPALLMERVNQVFFESTRPEDFATLLYGVHDSAARTLRYVNCAHPSAVLLRANGDFELLDATATMLGAFKNRAFEEHSIEVQSGDRLVLFSDGFSEARMEEDASDGWAVETILSLARSSGSGLAGALASLATEGGRQRDDVTVLDVWFL
jgi:sigma-B regulation protein RsbU (phosphoserine phosphatase)